MRSTLLRITTFLLIAFATAVGAKQPIPAAEDLASSIAPPKPAEALSTESTGGSQRQAMVNWQAWETLVYLMWPANPAYRGKPDTQARPYAPGPRVWETMKEQYEVYPKDGSKPLPWNANQPIPRACSGLLTDNTNARLLYRDEKVDDVLDATSQAVKADGTLPATLTDLNGNVVRYEIRFNQTVYDYVVENRLYNGEQQAKAQNISFPSGSIIIKAAWKELSSEEQTEYSDRFMVRDACICESDDFAECRTAKTGLVGFHVMKKTPDAPQWIWSTFEQVANVAADEGMPANFNNPHCEGEYCAPNSQTPTGMPNQVTQLLAITPELQHLNWAWRERLNNLNWNLGNYRLMSAQWPIQQPQSAEHPTVFAVQPTWSANTTMETFAQETSSCMGCHVMSRSLNPQKFVSGDFTFTLNNANPKPTGATCGEYGFSNSMFCSDDLILFSPEKLGGLSKNEAEQVTRGHQLVTQTYELLPDKVGNKLHCESCHLQAGGDPNAVWWVDMSRHYTPKSALQDRINGCFKRSMNGTDLCESGTDCDANQPMNDIISYMDWLTDEYYETKCPDGREAGNCPKPARDYPPINESLVGNIETGHSIFLQKCAFCHDSDGQGRYESNTYFRPALWGPNSYNVSAGLGKNARTLAQFLRWNMPYTSGGLLTDQEAQDIACFIDAQVRPGKPNYGVPVPSPTTPPATPVCRP